MCGIAGVASGSNLFDKETLISMRDSMRHRGPDDHGVWWSGDGKVGLAHRRLAIIDLSPGGHQPMLDPSGSVTITFNGEIYNFRELRQQLETKGNVFTTSSDTEVLIAAYRTWGFDCLAHLNGMFSFAIYDSVKRLIFIARDRAGEKPLFYRHANGRITFASELKALMLDPSEPRRVDPDALDCYLTYGFVTGELCILEGVRKLAAATALTYSIDFDQVKTWTYWSPPEPELRTAGSEVDLLAELDNLLLDSVRMRMISDVPVGILLSGGIDSSLVTAMAARVTSRPVKTFTISFPGAGKYDESPYARLVASHFGTNHVELEAEAASISLLPELIRQFDEPIADSSMIPTFLVSRLIRSEATVALGGDGGDELFGGYSHYRWIQRQEKARKVSPAFIRRIAASIAGRWMPIGMRGRNHLIGFSDGTAQSVAHVNMFFDRAARQRLLQGHAAERGRFSAEEHKKQICLDSRSPLQNATLVDFKTYLPDDILVKVDRASMLASLEMRAPWLDHRLIEFAFSRVPDTLRSANGQLKILPRLLSKRLLPPALDLNRKQGFSIPLHRWFSGEWGSFMTDVLLDSDAKRFDLKLIQSLVKGQRRGYSNIHRLFALTVLELWRREYRVSF